MKELCEVAGIQYHIVLAYNISKACPRCGFMDRLNRCGEIFKCIGCGFTADADYVGRLMFYEDFIHGDFRGAYGSSACVGYFIGTWDKCL
jgi:predicted RNA-binding Zn-ribbon protein involved in translation (DUF1610 family)